MEIVGEYYGFKLVDGQSLVEVADEYDRRLKGCEMEIVGEYYGFKLVDGQYCLIKKDKVDQIKTLGKKVLVLCKDLKFEIDDDFSEIVKKLNR